MNDFWLHWWPWIVTGLCIGFCIIGIIGLCVFFYGLGQRDEARYHYSRLKNRSNGQ